MLQTFVRCLIVILILFVAAPFLRADDPPKTVARNWNNDPAVVEIDTPNIVYALGDIHGDYDRLITVLLATKIITADPPSPDKVQWAAGKAVFVQTGDLIDKGTQSIPVLLLMRALQADAARAGGRVVVLSGNHEMEFLASNGATNKAVEFVAELGQRKIDPKTVAAGEDALGLGAFLRTLPFAARVNDWFFSHAGNTGSASARKFAANGESLTLKELRSFIQDGVDQKGYGTPALFDPDSLLEARLAKPRPWWDHEGDKPGDGRQRLARYVKTLGVKHLVIGHQPGAVEFNDGTKKRKRGEMFQHDNGLIFLIDVGMSRAVGDSSGAVLQIDAGGKKATALYPNGTSKVLWE